MTFADGGSAIAAWTVTVANAPGALADARRPARARCRRRSRRRRRRRHRCSAAPKRALYRAVAPAQAVSIKQLDAALVGYLGLGDAARAIQATLKQAGLNPPANTGSEAVARMLELRLNHPAGQDDLELRPVPGRDARRGRVVVRAGPAARQLGDRPRAQRGGVVHAADADDAGSATLLTTAIHYVGYPYVWGGTSPASGLRLLGLRLARRQADAVCRRGRPRERAPRPDDLPDERRGAARQARCRRRRSSPPT